MHAPLRTWSVAAVALALGVGALAAARGRGDDEAEEKKRKTAAAQEAVLKLADAVNGPAADFQAQAAALSRDHDLEYVMRQFKPRKDGGIDADGFENRLLKLGRKELPGQELAADKAALQRLAEVARGVAEAVPPYGKDYAGAGKTVEGWNKYAEDMKKGSQDLLDAVKAGDALAVRKAAFRLNGSCVGCHRDYRPQ
jgi:hypothetical protein